MIGPMRLLRLVGSFTLALLLYACSEDDDTTTPQPTTTTTTGTPTGTGSGTPAGTTGPECGDGTCDPGEDATSCPADCDPGQVPDDPVPCASAEVIFCSGFEEGDWRSVWDDDDGNTDSTTEVIDDLGPFDAAGNRVMRFRLPPGEGIGDLIKELPSQHDRLYFRFFQLWEDGYDFSARNHGTSMRAGESSTLGQSGYRPEPDVSYGGGLEPIAGHDDLQGRLNFYSYYRGMYQDCVDPNGSCWGDHFPCMFDEGGPGGYCEKPEHRDPPTPPQLETGRWYCIEMMIDGGSAVTSDSEADGVQTFWLDGQQFGPFEGLWHRSTTALKLSLLWIKLYHHADHSVQGVMLDEIAVSTERVGCGPLVLP